MKTWPSCSSSLLAALLACACARPVRPTATGAEPMVSAPPAAASVAEEKPVRPEARFPVAVDAQARLLALVRSGRTMYVKHVGPEGVACVSVRATPTDQAGTTGKLSIGEQAGQYELRRGHLLVSKAAGSADFAAGEVWQLHGVDGDGVLLGGALVTPSREHCLADQGHRPLGLVRDRCGELPELSRKDTVGAGETPWILSLATLASPCRWAGAYVADGVRYPFELYVPLRRAWLGGPWAHAAGGSVVDFRLDAGRLRLGTMVVEPPPALLTVPPAQTKPAPAAGDAQDFAAQFLAEARPLYVPILGTAARRCAAVELSAAHGTVVLPSYSGAARALGYTKDELGIALWRASPAKTTAQHGRTQVTGQECSAPRVRLAVHGRDDEAYHVEGSRWFFDGARCEAAAARTLPALVELLDGVRDNCWGPDPGLMMAAGLRSGTYYVRRAAGESACVAVEVEAPAKGQSRGRIRLLGSSATTYRYETLAGGRFIWRAPSDASGPDEGELVGIQPFEHGLHVGNASWFTDEMTCAAPR